MGIGVVGAPSDWSDDSAKKVWVRKIPSSCRPMPNLVTFSETKLCFREYELGDNEKPSVVKQLNAIHGINKNAHVLSLIVVILET